MFQLADPIFVAERQRTLLREAHNERLARLAQSRRSSTSRPMSLAARLGPIVAGRLGRLLPVAR